MKLFDKVKDFLDKEAGNNYDEQMQEPMPQQDYSGAAVQSEPSFTDFGDPMQGSQMKNVVDFRTSGRTPVMLKKVTNFAETQSVADALNEKRIVIINLESCKKEEAVRVIDFLSGVAYANGGGLKPIAGRAYIITPERVPLTGDFGEDVDAAAMNSNSFEY